MGCTSKSIVNHVAHLSSWENFPEWNSLDLLSADSNLGCGLLGGRKSITQAWPPVFYWFFCPMAQSCSSLAVSPWWVWRTNVMQVNPCKRETRIWWLHLKNHDPVVLCIWGKQGCKRRLGGILPGDSSPSAVCSLRLQPEAEPGLWGLGPRLSRLVCSALGERRLCRDDSC